MTINANVDKRIRLFILSRLPAENGTLPDESFSISVRSIVEALPGLYRRDVMEQIRELYVGGWWFSTDHGEPTPEESVTLKSVLRPTKGWTFEELREALEKPPLLSKRESPGYGPRRERW